MKNLILIAMALLLGSCLSIPEDSVLKNQKNFMKGLGLKAPVISCKKASVYATGYKDGERGFNMNPDKVNTCPPETQELLSQAYIEGYRAGVQDGAAASSKTKNVYVQPRLPKRECIKNFTDEICGYDCKKVHTNAGCAQSPYGNCETTPWHVTCGINCSKDRWDKITCDQVTYTSDK